MLRMPPMLRHAMLLRRRFKSMPSRGGVPRCLFYLSGFAASLAAAVAALLERLFACRRFRCLREMIAIVTGNIAVSFIIRLLPLPRFVAIRFTPPSRQQAYAA